MSAGEAGGMGEAGGLGGAEARGPSQAAARGLFREAIQGRVVGVSPCSCDCSLMLACGSIGFESLQVKQYTFRLMVNGGVSSPYMVPGGPYMHLAPYSQVHILGTLNPNIASCWHMEC